MPETYLFRCPCCGQMAPRDRLEDSTGPFPLESWLQRYGGKVKLSEEERFAHLGESSGHGSAPGRMSYQELPMDDELKELFQKRLQEVQGQLG